MNTEAEDRMDEPGMGARIATEHAMEKVHEEINSTEITVAGLIRILQTIPKQDQDLPITVLYEDGAELPLRKRPITKEGGGASPAFYAINVVAS